VPRRQSHALGLELFTIKLRQGIRAGYDRLGLGSGTSVRLTAALVVSAVFVAVMLGASFAAKLPVGAALAFGGLILFAVFGASAALILWSSDGQLSDRRAAVEEEIRHARELADVEAEEEAADRRREDAADRRDERRRRREDAEDRHARRVREARDDGFRCPYCRTREYPVMRSKVSAAGWVFFWLTCLFLCWPICWIGLFITDTYCECPACGSRS
jgi:rubrerythrin